MLGKRKRQTRVTHRLSDDEVKLSVSEMEDQEIFRRYFEERFEPLPEKEADTSPSPVQEQDDDSINGEKTPSEDSEWSGISDGESDEARQVEIVEVQAVSSTTTEHTIEQSFSRTFMSSKPPTADLWEPTARKQVADQPEDDDQTESLNLRNDLDLQRLLRESHLLEKSRGSTTPGSHRHQAIDMRLQSLGSKKSLFSQEKMPLAHRKGIAAKAVAKEALRRQQAQENGIILEKATSGRKRATKVKRETAVGDAAVGKFRDGMLKLSRRDLLEIQGTRPVGTKIRKRSRR